MTLTTHAIVGAAVAKIFSFNPIVAIVAAFGSHFLVDAVPHWDYLPYSFKRDSKNPMNNDMVIGKYFFIDLLRIIFDASLGVCLSLILFWPANYYYFLIIVSGAMFGILPDPLQFVYWKTRMEPFVSLQRFHVWIHSKNTSLLGRHFVGLSLQAFFALSIAVSANVLSA